MVAADHLALAKPVLDRAVVVTSRFGVSRRDIWRKIAAGAVARGFGAKVTEADGRATDALRKYERRSGTAKQGARWGWGGEEEDGGSKVGRGGGAGRSKVGTSRRAAEAYGVTRVRRVELVRGPVRP